jgi:serine/threonine-protein phosphatase 4 regulatory subunit 4
LVLSCVQLVSAALPLFSCRWVKEHLLEGVLGLLGDGVPNVRLAALGLLPALKQTIRLPEDVERLVRARRAWALLCFCMQKYAAGGFAVAVV